MPDERSDADIIESSLADPNAFGLIFDRHFGVISRYAERRAGRQVAEEIASETFVQAFRGRMRYDLARKNARPWLFGIATNLLSHHWRDEVTRLDAYSKVDPPPAASDDPLDARMAVLGILDALKHLDRRDRDVLMLYAWADLSYSDISEAISVPIGTVRSRLNRARRILRELADAATATGNRESEEEETGG